MNKATLFDVAVIEPVGGHGGMDYYDFGLCSGLADVGIKVVLYTCDETRQPERPNYIVNNWFCGIYGRQHVIVRGIKFLTAIFHVFWDVILKGIPVVHFHFFDVGILQIAQIILAKILFRKIIVTVHDVEGFVEGKGSLTMAKLAYGWSNQLVVHNDYSQTELISRLGIPQSCINIIPSGNYEHVSSSSISREAARIKLGWADNVKTILFFGQLKGIKRLDLLLKALPKVLDYCQDIHLIIAGKEVDVPFSIYQELICENALQNKCTSIIRYIDNEEVPLFFAAADLVVLPYERIYQSAVLLMAMSFSRAVVVSDIPGMLEVVKDGETGYVFQSGNENSLSVSLIRALENDHERNSIALNGYELVVREHSWQSIRKQHAELYKNVLN